MFAALSFLHPWLLLALLSLPILWWLLRLTPPAPRKISFPAIRLLFHLQPKEETPQQSPWWLLLLRLALSALLILAFAHPIWDEDAPFTASGPVLLLIDNDWATAAHWQDHLGLAQDILDDAERNNREAGIVPSADLDQALLFGQARTVKNHLQEIQPEAWLPNRRDLKAFLENKTWPENLNIFWLSDGLSQSEMDRPLMEALERIGHLTIYRADPGRLPRLFLGPEDWGKNIRVARPAGGPEEKLVLSAYDSADRRLASETISFKSGSLLEMHTFTWPLELINRIKHIDIDGQDHAGAVQLLGDQNGAKPIGFITGNPQADRQAFIGPLYYVEKALGEAGLVKSGPVSLLLAQPLSVLLLPDNAALTDEDQKSLAAWIEKGGMLVRFAGDNLASTEKKDILLPVHLRSGVRQLGGTLSWTQASGLASFPKQSPFVGLEIPKDVHIQTQVLAEPEIDLERKTWAALEDGTPIVTGASKGKGFLVLFHTSGTAAWSDLVLSGLFVDMLHRLVDLSQGISNEPVDANRLYPPAFLLNGFGHLLPADKEGRAMNLNELQLGPAGPAFRPGLYGEKGKLLPFNSSTGWKNPPSILDLPQMKDLKRREIIDFKPWLLLAAFILLLSDFALSLFLRGLLSFRRQSIAAFFLLLGSFLASSIDKAQAQNTDEDIARLTDATHLAYVTTGVQTVDQISRAGLIGLTGVLLQRTSSDLGDPVAVDLETDELSFYPILYWPITSEQEALSPEAIIKVNSYLAKGGMIFFDTGDKPLENLAPGDAGPSMARLQELTTGLNIPNLIPMPADHVLTKAFYLLRDFPGRWIGGTVWVEAHGGQLNDGVTSIIIGSNDYAAAWAIDEYGRPLYAVTPGGERQRELAYRFGVNVLMYALTGNYKTDQVHVPAILQRLGQ